LQSQDRRQGGEYGNLFCAGQQYGGFLQQANLVQKHRGEIVDLHGMFSAITMALNLHNRPAQRTW